MTRGWLALLLTLLVSPVFAEPAPDVALVLMGQTHSYWSALRRGVEFAASEQGLKVINLDPEFENQIDSQRGLVRRAVRLGVRGIIIAPNDQHGLMDELRLARVAGVRVVVVDSAAGQLLDGFVASDNQIAGAAMGRYLRQQLSASSRLVVMCGPLTVGSLAGRYAGVTAELGVGMRLTSISENLLLVSESQRYLQPYTQSLLDADAVFACNESATEAMLAFFERQPKESWPELYGYDMSPSLLQRLERHELQAVMIQDPFVMGATAVDQLRQVWQGGKAEVRAVPTHLVDSAALNDPQVRRIIGRQL
ncbi:MAG: substrate-binding domain-containing protein [Gammaproteobacteria bacterium]|nr:substrate-binding domain-containing protein [Gammaproteobacteria bacterium]